MNRKESLAVIVILLMSLFIPVGAFPDQIAVASSPASGNIIPTIHSSVVYAIFEYPEQLSSIDMPHIIYDNLNIVEIHTNNLDNLPSDLIYHRFNPQPLRFESNAVRYSLPELFEIVGLKPIHDAGNTGGSQYYVQIDDGIDSNHPSFQDRIVEVIDVSFPDAEECAVHGTAVAGVATAGIGVRGYETIVGSAPDAAIISYAVGCRNGSYGGNFLKAYNDAITKNDTIRVLNTSFGGSGVIVDQIIERLARSGILVVGSAGNKGPDYNSTGTGGPGNSIHALSVGSVINETTVADFSARGYAHNLQLKPDVVAPGVGINTTNSNEGRTHAVTSGTSISSPFVAGGILALLDALPDFMKTNPGLLKAAIMKGAKQIAEDQRIDGHGLVNFSRSLELILEAEQNEGVPLLVELTPDSGPNPFVSILPAQTVATSELTMISSNPQLVEFTFSGNLSGRVSVSQVSKDYSQSIQLQIDTSGLDLGDLLVGEIVASIGNDISNSSLTFEVGHPYKGKVAMDLRHTWWDLTNFNGIGGSNTGEFAKLLNLEGWKVEEVDDYLSQELLEGYDLLWMPDGFNHFENRTSDLVGIMEYILEPEEIQNIVKFVESGRHLLLDAIGTIRNEQNEPSYANRTILNQLIGHFGMQMVSDPLPTQLGYFPTFPILTTPLHEEVSSITHFGNFLKIDHPALPVVTTADGKPTTGIYTSKGGGKVMVTSTNFWLDNGGIREQYTEHGGESDLQFSKNVIDWYSSPSYIHLLERSEMEDMIEFVIQSSDPFIVEASNAYFLEVIDEKTTKISIPKLDTYRLVLSIGPEFLDLSNKQKLAVDLLVKDYSFGRDPISFNGTISMYGNIDYTRIGIQVNDFYIPNQYFTVDPITGTLKFELTSEITLPMLNFYPIEDLIINISIQDSNGYIHSIDFPLNQQVYPGKEIGSVFARMGISILLLIVVHSLYSRRDILSLIFRPRYL